AWQRDGRPWDDRSRRPARAAPGTVQELSADGGHVSESEQGQVVVIGSANRDYLIRLAHPPAPQERARAQGRSKSTGGKGASQAVAAARMGGDVVFVGRVGRDEDGEVVRAALRADAVGTSRLQASQEPTGIALVSIDTQGENSIVVVPGANF